MTCIVGIETPRGVVLGADSLGADPESWSASEHAEPKVFRVGPYVIGFTTSFRMGDILRYHVTLPKPPAQAPLHRHLVTKVVPVLRAAFRRHGFLASKEGADVGGDFLIGVRGRLFHVFADHQVGRAAHGYDAAGCGAQSALGALSVCADVKRPRESLRRALVAAERHNMGVRGPWKFLGEPRPA
jgi:hypothetical protein